MRIAEPDVDLQPPGQFRVAGHLGTAIIGHAFAQGRRQAFHLAGEAVEHGIGAVAVRSALQSIPRIDCFTLELHRTTKRVLR